LGGIQTYTAIAMHQKRQET